MAYNVKIYEYDDFYQYRFYDRPVLSKGDRLIEESKDTREDSEKSSEKAIIQNEDAGKDKDAEDDLKREHSKSVSINRSIQSIYELVFANKWDYFITLTFDPKKVNSLDYDVVIKKTSQWLNNMSKRKAAGNLKYIFIPERHKSGSYHIHGLLADCGTMEFTDSGRVAIGKKAYKRTSKNAHYPTIYNIGNWRYGFSDATQVQDNDRVCSYFTKYITKDLVVDLKGRRRYYPSNNLKRARVEELIGEHRDIEKFIIDMMIDGQIDYIKEQDIPEANQRIRYITVLKKSNN